MNYLFFSVLCTRLSAYIADWKQEQLELIAGLPAAQQAQARMDLQQQEMRYLTSMERLRHIARVENRETSAQNFLDKVNCALCSVGWLSLLIIMAMCHVKSAKQGLAVYYLLVAFIYTSKLLLNSAGSRAPAVD